MRGHRPHEDGGGPTSYGLGRRGPMPVTAGGRAALTIGNVAGSVKGLPKKSRAFPCRQGGEGERPSLHRRMFRAWTIAAISRRHRGVDRVLASGWTLQDVVEASP